MNTRPSNTALEREWLCLKLIGSLKDFQKFLSTLPTSWPDHHHPPPTLEHRYPLGRCRSRQSVSQPWRHPPGTRRERIMRMEICVGTFPPGVPLTLVWPLRPSCHHNHNLITSPLRSQVSDNLTGVDSCRLNPWSGARKQGCEPFLLNRPGAWKVDIYNDENCREIDGGGAQANLLSLES